MIDLTAIDQQIMRAMQGLDGFEATFHGDGDPMTCRVLRDTLELPNEYGVTVIQSGAVVNYLASDIAVARIGDRFEFDGKRYVIEDHVPSQDSSWRRAHCRVEHD